MRSTSRPERLRRLLHLPELKERAATFSSVVDRPAASVELVSGSEFDKALEELALQGDRLAAQHSNTVGVFWRVLTPAEFGVLAAYLKSAQLVDDVPLIILDTGGSGVGGIRTSLRELAAHLSDLVPALGEDILATSNDASSCLIVHANEVEGDDGEYEVAALGGWVGAIDWPDVGRPPTEPLESPVYG